MGQAKSRGSEESRIALAVDKKETKAAAIEDRTHAKGLAWVAFEVTTSIQAYTLEGEPSLDEDGKAIWSADPTEWRLIHAWDTPDWLRQDEIIGKLMNGEEISWRPEKDGRWWRGIVMTPEEEEGDSLILSADGKKLESAS